MMSLKIALSKVYNDNQSESESAIGHSRDYDLKMKMFFHC